MGHLMTRTDYKVIFTALGFLAVILDNVPRDRQASRATALAQLIEAFCATAKPFALGTYPVTRGEYAAFVGTGRRLRSDCMVASRRIIRSDLMG
jgi:hypothetical protein